MFNLIRIAVTTTKLHAGIFVLALFVSATLSNQASADNGPRAFSTHDLRGTWTVVAWIDSTLLIPFPAEIVTSPGVTVTVAPGDKVNILGSLVGLVEFDGRGGIPSFQDVIKIGAVRPLAPFPLPFLPPFPEQGAGTYTVEPNGTAHMAIDFVNPDNSIAANMELQCVLSRAPRQVECVIARFKTFAVDPNGFEAPVTGIFTLKRQR